MKSIKFSDSEVEFLQTHYELELMDAENYVEEIKNILKKLGAIDQEVAREKIVKKTGKKTGRPKKEKKAEVIVAAEVPDKAVKPVVVKKAKEAEPKKIEKVVPKKGKKGSKKAPVKKPASSKVTAPHAVVPPATS